MARFGLSIRGVSLFILVGTLVVVEVKGESLDLRKEAVKYKTCQGHDFQFGSYLVNALTAFATGGCLQFSDYGCAGICVMKHFDGGNAITMEGERLKLSKKWVKSEYANFLKSQSPALHKPIERLFKAFKECNKWHANEIDGGQIFKYPTESSDKCSDVNEMKNCFEAKHAKICKEEENAEDFLDA